MGNTVTTQRPKEATDCEEGQQDTEWLVNLSKEDHPQEKERRRSEKTDHPPESREEVELEVRL
jgi:hypothetical protein